MKRRIQHCIYIMSSMYTYTYKYTDRYNRENTEKKFARVLKVVIVGWEKGIMMNCIYFIYIVLYFPVVYTEH